MDHFGFRGIFLLGFQLHVGKAQLLQAFAYGRAPASSPGTRQGFAKTGWSLLLDGSRHLSSWTGGAPPWQGLPMRAWRGACTFMPSWSLPGQSTGPASAPWHSMGSAHMLGPPVDVGQRTKEKDVKTTTTLMASQTRQSEWL